MKIIISKITAYFYIALWHVRHCSKCFTMYLCNSHFMKVILKCKGLLSDTGNWRNRISIVKVKIFLARLCLFVTLWTVAHQTSLMGSSRLGIFLTQGSNLGLSNCRCILYHLSDQESPAGNLTPESLNFLKK